ncbi:C6 finger domain-containing protein [Xylariaceae sp. FL0016]|nr:C6 finger domain-containing protein [Xylariaceae sp. FL0016]
MTGAAAGSRRVPKLGHKKSMFGCQRCRSRRVKCNEAKPICGNCERHGLPCVYDRNGFSKGKGSHITTPPEESCSPESHSAPQGQASDRRDHDMGMGDGEDPPEGRERRMLEARLMHQYVSETGSTIAIDDVSRGVFAKSIPGLAFHSDALLYAMYAVAAVHLVKKGEDGDGRFRDAAGQYFAMAIREHNAEVNQASRETVDAICLTSALIRLYAFLQMLGRPSRPYQPPWEWMIITKTSVATFAEAWKLVGSDPNSLAFQLMKNTRHIHNNGKVHKRQKPPRPELEPLLTEQRQLSEPWSPEIQSAYEETIGFISDVLDIIDEKGASSDAHRMLVLCPMLVDPMYVDLVRRAVPRALVILAYYFSIYKSYDSHWWVGDLGVQEVRSIYSVLSDDWKKYMDWPFKMIEK